MSDGNAVRVCRQHNQALEERGLHLVCLGPPLHRVTSWGVVDRAKGRTLYEADEEKGATKVMNEKTTVAMAPKPKSETLERAKLRDGTGLTLWLRVAREPKAYGGDPFRIKWAQLSADGKKSTGGVVKTCADEPAGRAAFKATLKAAIDQGWKQVTINAGPRRLEFKPVPAPKKRAS